jgi:lipoic acid synthetase
VRAGVSMITVGQYLRPTRDSLSVKEYLAPELFDQYRLAGEALGLLVHAGPFVRSSFRAGETLAAAQERRGQQGGAELQ